jgi:fructose-bisphosphate aldolase class 1
MNMEQVAMINSETGKELKKLIPSDSNSAATKRDIDSVGMESNEDPAKKNRRELEKYWLKLLLLYYFQTVSYIQESSLRLSLLKLV